MRRARVKKPAPSGPTRIELVQRLAKQITALEKLGFERIAANLEEARREFEVAKEEAKRAAAKRDAARRHMNVLEGSLRAIKPKHDKQTERFDQMFEHALAARCGDLKRVAQPLQRALSHVQEEQRKRDFENSVHEALERISAAASFQEALNVVGVEVGTSIPPEREREWREKSARVRLIAAVLQRRGNLNELQMQIVAPYLTRPRAFE